MSKHGELPHESDPDNSAFARLVEQLAGYGVTQQDIAQHLGITPGHLARVKKGERHAKASHVEALREFLGQRASETRARAKAARSGTLTSPVLSMNHSTLGRLSSVEAVEAFRDLLWSRAAMRGIPNTLVRISSNVTEADGGVDASIRASGNLEFDRDDLLTSGTRFQIKTGEATPWQKSYIKTELFGTKDIGFENLGSEVQKALREKSRYVLVCFGTDAAGGKLETAADHLRWAFAQCGYKGVDVEVWGQTDLVGLFSDYPSLCLRLRGFSFDGFCSHASWSGLADMQPPVRYSPETFQLIKELRSDLISGTFPHLRLLGEPGIGKTRLALEITSDEQLAPVTLYIPDGRHFLKGSFINELVSADNTRQAILVIDDCGERDRASIWNALKGHRDKIRLISIDHAPDAGTDEQMKKLIVPPTQKTQIVQILRGYGIGENDAQRWADYCEGCPRVAHMLGENLRENRTDLLQPPAINDVWDRFIVGNDNRDTEDVTLRRIILMFASLFERFGFEAPVDSEAKFIASLAQQMDPRITWGRFQAIVEQLRKRRILQGAKTLYITPRILHVYLFREFWNSYGNGFDVSSAMTQMPPQLWNWFVKMLKYAHDTRYGEEAAERVLDSTGMFSSGRFPNDPQFGTIIDVIAETNPKATLRFLERTLGAMDKDALVALDAPRQRIVWALEKIAVYEEFFEEAALLLLALAEAENAKNSNNATGTFLQLFSLIPQLAVTQAKPSVRLRTLETLLSSAEPTRRRLGLQGCARALDTSPTSRVVGPEHQGLRRTIEFWMPKTYGDLWAAHEDVWNLLLSKLDEWQGGQRLQVIDTLIQAAWSSIYIPPLTTKVLDLLDRVAKEDGVNVGAIVSFCKRQLNNKDSKLPAEVQERLRTLCESLAEGDLRSRLLRWVKFVTHEDTWSRGASSTKYSQIIEELANEASNDLGVLVKELPWLVEVNSGAAYGFAYQIGQRDLDLNLYDAILTAQSESATPDAIMFLSGYLGAIFHRDSKQWEELIIPLTSNPAVASRFSDIVISSGISNKVARQVIEHCRAGHQDIALLERWWFADQLKALDERVIEEFVAILTEPQTNSSYWGIAVQMLHTYYLQNEAAPEFSVDMLWQVLIHPALSQRGHMHRIGYHWGKLANALLAKAPDRKWEFFREVLNVGVQEWSAISDINEHADDILTDILRSAPETAFDLIAEVLSEADHNGSYAIRNWLGGSPHFFGDLHSGPIQYIPSVKLFGWVDRNVDTNSDMLISMLPKTLDESVAGRLTRDFISKFGSDARTRGRVTSHFWEGGHFGEASVHYRNKSDEARSWLISEKDPVVVKWVREYIDVLNKEIERAELEEEREG
ncbi:hypothetical protein [Aeoliella sp. SH292]|uniref:hypothetical protein n=1 Tax=Aeoliella sp. SH292 TaxID=3454464 RepID=UPI003F9984A2